MAKMQFNHTPVMLEECITGLKISKNGIYVDGTLGGGGHSAEIVKRLDKGKLVAIDKDQDALEICRERLAEYGDKILFVHSDFKDCNKALASVGIEKVDGILLDLGVSSYQIDTPDRGFSYRFDGPLDMRMNRENALTAYDVVNSYSPAELARILHVYGEEDNARAIVNAICKQRDIAPISNTKELADIVEGAIPQRYKIRGSAAKKTFQAIRIEVNGELSGLDSAITDMVSVLNKGGRLAIITFHSLEDRIVKNVFKLLCTDCICDKSSPICVCNHKAECIPVTKKPITPSAKELSQNKRSSSAKLRIIEKK